jgi:hypothetical protein
MMAKEAHTPGPWKIDGATVFALDERGHVNRFSASVQGGYVSYLRFSPRSKGERTSDAELEANARLMAAAPDGLEIAEEFLAFAREGGPFTYPPGSLQKLEQFIAKARGESA